MYYICIFPSCKSRCMPWVYLGHNKEHEELHSCNAYSWMCSRFQGMFKKKQNSPNVESLASRTANQDLTCSFTPPRNVTLNQSLWNFLNNTTDVIYRIRPLQSLPQQKVTLPKILFSSGNIFFILPGFYLQKISILYSCFEPLFIY